MKTLLKTNLSFLCLVVLLCFGITSMSYGQAVISVDPAESVSPAVGSQLTIRLNISNGQNVAGYDMSVNFDTSALRYVSSATGSYLPSGALFLPPAVSDGIVTLVALPVSGAASSRSGTLASVTFSVIAVKASTLRLTRVFLMDSSANGLSVSVRNGSIVERRGAKWDINGDGTVNVLDLVRVATSLGSQNAGTDINGDGTVNVLDLVTVAQHLGESVGTPDTPSVVPPPVALLPETTRDDHMSHFESCQAIDPRLSTGDGDSTIKYAVGYTKYVWTAVDTVDPNDSNSDLVLTVKFIKGSRDERKLVEEVAPTWTKGDVPFTFRFVDRGPSDIRVGFDSNLGNQSLLGTEANRVEGATMNLVLEGARHPERPILHEFGHALGLGHEHQNPASPISWDREEVIKDVKNRWGWSEEEIIDNILTGININHANFTEFDPESIMIYPIPENWTLDGFTRGWNLKLSSTDKTFIRDLYSGSPFDEFDNPFGRVEIPMVRIPGGAFQMGSNSGSDMEKPAHSVYVDAFYMDKYQVTNTQYVEFLNEKGKHTENGRPWVKPSENRGIVYSDGAYRAGAGYGNLPARVTWYGAMAYAKWKGKRLPTEAEWEKAARGGLTGKKYPWGNTLDRTKVADAEFIGEPERPIEQQPKWEVGQYPPNGYGLYDMVGGAGEWCLDPYVVNRYAFGYAFSSRINPMPDWSIQWLLDNYTQIESSRISRGGHSGSPWAVFQRGSFGPLPDGSSGQDGFRCVRSDWTPRPPTAAIDGIPIEVEGMMLIPAGKFQMGQTEDIWEVIQGDERHSFGIVLRVHLDAFYMDKYEVTNAQYKKFVDANPEWQKNRIPASFHDGDYLRHWNGNEYPAGKANHPVEFVSWYAAMAYAKWAGKRLPTEAEWEKAARGGFRARKYPWGDDSIKASNGNIFSGRSTEVGQYPANGYGLYDMAGNVEEWCLDEFTFFPPFLSSEPNPVAGENSIQWLLDNYTRVNSGRVLRGGYYGEGGGAYTESLRVDYRESIAEPRSANSAIGFRCVKSVSASGSR